jgi:hypothetical protein
MQNLFGLKSNLEKDFAETVYLSEAPSPPSAWGGHIQFVKVLQYSTGIWSPT